MKGTVCYNRLKFYLMNTNVKGTLIETKFLSKITELGFSVSIPFGDKNRYDQIWDINGTLIKVQIKSCRWKDERHIGIIFNCYSVCNGKKHFYTKNDIDYFAISWNDKFYLIPVEECSSEKTLWFELSSKSNGKCSMATDYEIEKVLGI